jgi:phosphatidylethanolamine-binding protein (PEBP) family uncharacterized protein
MIDPDVTLEDEDYMDAPRQFLHWLVINVPGHAVSKGDVVDNYVVPAPADPIFTHRYIELVYRQPERFKESVPYERLDFDIQKFADQHHLGRPVAGNFFISALD